MRRLMVAQSESMRRKDVKFGCRFDGTTLGFIERMLAARAMDVTYSTNMSNNLLSSWLSIILSELLVRHSADVSQRALD